ncbi:hypothetical protein CHS0354_001357 [Potamilus streckersoni]|uniref:Uncharacterized protein n=1 Tax=Potamilus streckersoni TaxID=2493646 RepID=A0AAE0TFG5_9BIVA|nr:hypothetical protein CHS0354_001357 [Potamilus streckersoni]
MSSSDQYYQSKSWKSSVHLKKEERRRLASLLIKYQNIFSKSSDDLGRTDLVKCRVNAANATPSRLPIEKKRNREGGSQENA